MGLFRLVLCLEEFLKGLDISRGQNDTLLAIDAFSLPPSGKEDGRPDRFTSVLILSNKSRKKISNQLDHLVKQGKIKEDELGRAIDLIQNSSVFEIIEASVYVPSLFDIKWNSTKSNKLTPTSTYNLSLQGLIESGTGFTHFEFLSTFLSYMNSNELIVCDQYLFLKHDANSADAFGKAVLKFLYSIKDFLRSKMFGRIVLVFNSYLVSLLDEEELSEAINRSKEDYASYIFNNCSISLVNLAESGRAQESGGKEQKVKGVFHSRQLFTEKYRIVFDTRVSPEKEKESNNNTFEIHPHYYDYKSSVYAGSNQLRGTHLLRFLYYLDEILVQAGASIESNCLDVFKEVYPNPRETLGKRYKTKLSFENVQVLTIT